MSVQKPELHVTFRGPDSLPPVPDVTKLVVPWTCVTFRREAPPATYLRP